MTEKLEHCFVSLLEEHQNILHKICSLYTEDNETHKDLFQEMTIQLWQSFPKFKGDSKFSTWAYRVCLNTAISLYRHNKKNIVTVEWDTSLYQLRHEEYNPEHEERLKVLYASVRQLNDIEKALVYMYLENKDYEEIAITLGISEGNARVKMNRIKTKLKNILNKQGGL